MKRSIDRCGNLIAVCGRSGSGKSTLARHALDVFSGELMYMKTLTTRGRRPKEDDAEYEFVDMDGYIKAKEVAIQWDESMIYGNFYGLDPTVYIERLRQGDNFIVCSAPSKDIISSMIDIYGESLKTVHIKTSEELSIERLRRRSIEGDMARVAIDRAAISESFQTDYSFEPVGNLDIDKPNFVNLIQRILYDSK